MKHLNVDIGLRVFTDGVESYVAYSPEDAKKAQFEFIGENPNDSEFYMLDPSMEREIFTEDGREPIIVKTCREWAIENGRGFLCSTEF